MVPDNDLFFHSVFLSAAARAWSILSNGYFLLLLVLVIISAGLISKYILAPFKRTLRVIQSFDLKQKTAIRLPDTQTSEFRELNVFLQKMTEKAREDYQSLKEFTENASHELQTPTAIIRANWTC
jgi:two-component system sensor histidine kinase QseC